MSVWIKCRECGGTGNTGSEGWGPGLIPCSSCGGSGGHYEPND